jgi:hypothetical protein
VGTRDGALDLEGGLVIAADLSCLLEATGISISVSVGSSVDTSVISTSVVSACAVTASFTSGSSSPVPSSAVAVGISTASPSVSALFSGLTSSSTGVPSLGVDALLFRSSSSLPPSSGTSSNFASSIIWTPSDGDGARDTSARGYAHALALPSFETAHNILPDFENRNELI